MPAPAPRPTPYRFLAAAIVLAGLVAAAIWHQRGWSEETRQAEAELARRALLQHAVAKEILHSYEDALTALTSLFIREGPVTRPEFVHATARIRERLAGAQAVEWVPLVTAAERRAVEAAGREAYAPLAFNFVDFDVRGLPYRAETRPFYYPVCHVDPLEGNEIALGYDLAAGNRRPFLDQARATERLVVTRPLSLVQDHNGAAAVIMIVPVFRPARGAAPAADPFVGFVLGVFRVREILASLDLGQSDPMLDLLVVDRAESDPARRSLFLRTEKIAGADTPLPAEAEFRHGRPVVEQSLSFGGLEWHLVYRPRATWLAEQHTYHPAIRSGSVVLLTGLMAGLVWVLGRRTETIRREVAERTAELGESRRQLAGLLHALPGMAFRCKLEPETTLTFVSEGARDLLGWSMEELLSGRWHFRDLIHPDDLPGLREATRQALRDRTELEHEYRVKTRSGEEKWVLCRGHGIYEDDGGFSSFEGLAIDITARKRAEQARLELERKLLEGQKLESLGLLAGGIAHDFNNLLSTILGNANILRASGTVSGPAANQVGAIETASLRAAELCRQMLAYAGKGRLVVEPMDLTALIQELLPLLEISIARQATLRRQLAIDLPAVMADGTQLRQIVMNLVINAADAIGERGGEIILTTGMMSADEAVLAECIAGDGRRAGQYVFLEVRDTGTGMTPEVMARIFDPFFTTKFAGRGLGLAAVLGIVRGHEGALRVASVPGEGSTFRLLLPPAGHTLPPPKPSDSGSSFRWRRAGPVLVIEDVESVRIVIMDLLKSVGLTPTGVTSGPEGVALYREQQPSFDLVVIDLLMPGMSGEQTLQALRTLNPRVPVLLVSGYTQDDVLGRVDSTGPTGFLSKPFTREAFERKLKELLG